MDALINIYENIPIPNNRNIACVFKNLSTEKNKFLYLYFIILNLSFYC